MKEMKSIINLFALGAFSLMVLALPSVASAQYYPNGGYGNGSYNRNIKGTVQNLKNRARNFERTTNRIEDRRDDRDDRWRNRNGGWNGGNIEKIEDLADDFKKATDKLADKYGNGRNLNNSRDAARRVLDLGGQIDQAMSRMRGNSMMSREWNMIRQDLNVIAQVYGYHDRGRSGTWRDRMPLPLPF